MKRVEGWAGLIAATAAFFLAGSACAARERARPDPHQEVGQPITVTFGPHWRAAFPVKTAEAFLCAGGNRMNVEFEYATPPSAQAGPRRRRVLAAEVNDSPVDRLAIDRLNRSLANFKAEPRFSPECYQKQFRVHLYEPQGGKSEYVDLAPVQGGR